MIFLKKISGCLNSEIITSDILKRFKFYREDDKKQLKEEDWNSIGVNETIYTDSLPGRQIKIKHYKKDLLKLNDFQLIRELSLYNAEILNIFGLIQNSLVKFNDKIEEYSKKLLKMIFSSDIYQKSFLRNDKRFKTEKQEEKKLLESFFKGVNKDIIFQEIWDNVFFLPFSADDFAGFNNPIYYSIFINTNYKNNYHKTFQEIIPCFHCDINTLIHEFTNNIALLLAANLNEDGFETIIIEENKNLLQLQKEYSIKYNQNNIIYDKFRDFGDLIEVELYGIRPRKFKTFSGLFCLDYNSYNYDQDKFRNVCVNLYNCNSDNKNEILESLLKSEIALLLKKYFTFSTPLLNENYIESGKSRRLDQISN